MDERDEGPEGDEHGEPSVPEGRAHPERGGRLGLHWQIVIAIAVGVVLGVIVDVLGRREVLAPGTVESIAGAGALLGRLFLSLLQMLVVPLILSSLVTGVATVPDMAGLRRLSGWTFGYYACTSVLAITAGLILVNLIGPGRGLAYEDLVASAQADGQTTPDAAFVAEEKGFAVVIELLERMVPDNVVAAASSNTLILSIIFFALMLGIFIKRTGGESGAVLTRFFQALFDVMMRMTSFVISLAPYGIFGAMLALAARGGLSIAGDLAMYMLTVALALGVHGLITLPIVLAVFARRSPFEYARAMSPALLTAFSTASSNGTLPLTMRCVEDRAGVSPRVSSFTLPLGATINMDGTALYEAVAVLFIAQTLGDLTLGQQVVVAFTALAASIGAAGIPQAGLVMMVIVLQAVGLPTEAVMVILAVDRLLDMARTSVNVWSDSCAAAVVASRAGDAASALPAAEKTTG
jgi:proton glutamate symport protein